MWIFKSTTWAQGAAFEDDACAAWLGSTGGPRLSRPVCSPPAAPFLATLASLAPCVSWALLSPGSPARWGLWEQSSVLSLCLNYSQALGVGGHVSH